MASRIQSTTARICFHAPSSNADLDVQIYRAHAIFGVTSALLVTQRYHLPRALFLARRLGIDDAVGVDAAKRSYVGQWSFNLREIAAVEVAWLQAVIIQPRPKFLGKHEPLP